MRGRYDATGSSPHTLESSSLLAADVEDAGREDYSESAPLTAIAKADAVVDVKAASKPLQSRPPGIVRTVEFADEEGKPLKRKPYRRRLAVLVLAVAFFSAAMATAATSGSSAGDPDPVPITVPIYRSPNTFEAERSFGNMLLNQRSNQTTLRPASAGLLNEADMLWSANISLANGQVFSMDLDTVYGLGAVAGDVFLGPITMAGLTSKIAVGVAAIELYMAGSDGLLGLGFESISNINLYTGLKASWFDNIGFPAAQQKFAFYLSNSIQGDTGEVTIGSYNSNKFTGNISWFPLTAETYWQMSIRNWTWAAGSRSGPLAPRAAQYNNVIPDAIVDTGTTLIFLPQAPADGINKAIGAVWNDDLQAYAFHSCSKKGLPTVTLTSPKPHSFTFEIEPDYYVIQNTDDNGVPTSDCFSGFVNGGDTLGIFGDVFIRSYYTIFDKAGKQLGFAKAKHPK
ncbi:hypothetical protein HK101_001592 [Irineochytrium annulatum]|nr:hypothetical protein HK101_001592 [Irineochytrium annulatum]